MRFVLVHRRRRPLWVGRVPYAVETVAASLPSGGWVGCLQFEAVEGSLLFRTGVETTQHSVKAVVRWANRLEEEYLRDALWRALGREATQQVPILLCEQPL